MIQIHLKKLMDDYGINISDLYRLTGISRSTLTPMVNDPESVSSLKVDILDTLCDFFGVSIDDLITFTPSKNKYAISEIWYNYDANTVIVDMKKELGSSNRHAIIGVFFDSLETDPTRGITLRISAEITPLTKDQIKGLSLNKSVDDFPNEKEIIDGNLFLEDFKKHERGTRILTTKIILENVFSDTLKKKFENIYSISAGWVPHGFLDHSNAFTFDVDRSNFSLSLNKEKTNGIN